MLVYVPYSDVFENATISIQWPCFKGFIVTFLNASPIAAFGMAYSSV